MAAIDEPVAGLDPLHRVSRSGTTWTRVNMAEAVPGVQTPLSWSFTDDSLDHSMRQGFHTLGVIARRAAPPATEVDERLVTICYGRSALNVDLFREIADATPWTSSEAFDEYYFGMAPTGERRRKRRRRYPIVLARALPACFSLHRRVQRNYHETQRWWATNTASSACDDVDGAEARLREAYDWFVRVASVHSAAAQIAGAICNMLTKLCVRAGRADLIMTLLGGHESVEVETTLDLWKVARDGLPMVEFTRRHGFQGPLMGELSSPSWRVDPRPIESLLESYRSMAEEMNPRAIERRRVEERERAEQELLSGLRGPLRIAARFVFAGLAVYIPCREFGKASMMMAFDVARGAADTLAGELARGGSIEDVGDVFYLTMPELLGSLPPDTRAVIADRRARRARYLNLELPDTWVGMPTPKDRRAGVAGAVRSGIGVSPGIALGRARVIEDLRQDARLEPGEILVCETTDPSWAAYFLVAGGVVTDIGGSMSHGAIVAREIGIPCIVNTKTATRTIRTGDLLRIDGTTGSIEVLAADADGMEPPRSGPENSREDGRAPGDRRAQLPWIVDFDTPQEISPRTQSLELGGKGANLAEMASVLRLRVPPGFTITTTACRATLAGGSSSALRPQIQQAVQRIEEKTGKRFGDPRAPLLLSVRSGAPVSMPGMMDSLLDLGLTPETLAGLAAWGGDAFAWSCFRRFIQTYVEVVLGRPGELTDRILDTCEREPGALSDRAAAVIAALGSKGLTIPADPWKQLMATCEAVVASWNSERARTYRRVEGIDDNLFTAVNVQSMVFGDLGPDSGTGVAFTRDPSTGLAGLVGDFLSGAQGEDVVAGTHRVESLSALAERAPGLFRELESVASKLERHYQDMCDIEFTIEAGELFLLQVRIGKRSPRAALRIAIDLVRDSAFPLGRREAVERTIDILADPPSADRPLDSLVPRASLVFGIGASPGVASGPVLFDPSAVAIAAAGGERAILVRAETSPADVHGMAEAAGILTATGGLMSHAAVVARAWGKPAVVGVEGLTVFADHAVLDGTRIEPRDCLTLDGSLGAVALGRFEVTSEPIPEVDTLLGWAAELGIEIARVPPEAAEREIESVETDSRFEERGEDELIRDILVVLAIKRWATSGLIAETLGIDEDRLASIVRAQPVAAYLGEPTARGWSLSEAGERRTAEVWSDTADRLGSRTARLLESFDPPNTELKTLVTAWQMREVDGESVPNLHDDADHDAGVIEGLRDLHVEIDRWLADLSEAAPVIELFRRRLDRALDRIVAGDHRWLVSPRLDSYHTAWFELHECLLRIAGRSRAEEAKAGRAS